MDVEAALHSALGEDAVASGEALDERYLNDWSGQAPGQARLLVRPRSTEEVARVLALCNAHRQAVVPQGGMTGISGGGRPLGGEVVLSLERLRGIEEIDPAGMTMQLLAGTPLQEAQEAAAGAGLLLPLDLGARGSCLIGGNLATNAGGNRVIRYGMSRGLVLGLEVVLADGTVLSSLNRLVKNNAGYDLKQLFIGSEGTLGVITRAVLRLEPRPLSHAAAFLGLPTFADVVETLATLRGALGPSLTAFEVMWRAYGDVIADEAGQPLPVAGRHAFYVLVEQQGTDPANDAERLEAALGALLERGTVEDGAVAKSLAEVRTFWGVRDAVAEFPRLFGALHAYDVGLPIRHMEAYTREVTAALRGLLHDPVLLWFGHLGDGNLHLNVAERDRRPLPHAEIDRLVYAPLKAIGGTVTAEHGIGTTKRGFLNVARTEPEIDLMRRIKAALDPNGILNPGKVLPG